MNKRQLKKLKNKDSQNPNSDFLGKPTRKRFKALLFMTLGVLFFLLITGIFNKVGILEVLESERELSILKENITRLEKENRELVLEINSLQNDPRYIEKIARVDLGLALPGETTFIFED